MQFPEFLYPAMLYAAIPLLLLLLWLTWHSFVREDSRYDDAKSIRRRSRLRWTVFLLRTLAVLCLIVAIATPLIKQSIVRAGDSHITIVIDNSSSMGVMDMAFVPKLTEELRSKLPVTVHIIAPGEQSAIGEGVLSALKPNENILLISDGNNNEGPLLSEVAAFASQRNSTISAINLKSRVKDAAVTIEAPLKTVADTNTSFSVDISRTQDFDVQLQVLVDGKEMYNSKTSDSVVSFRQSFSAGTHQISAIITSGDDALPQNNRFDYLLISVEKPKVLIVTQKPSTLQPLFSQIYSVTITPTMPRTAKELEPYYAVVIIDVPISTVSGSTGALTDYLLAGNGILVVGGPHSFDYGGYKNTPFESLLPVTVGRAKENGGVSNIALAVDMSGSVSGAYSRDEKGQLVYKKSDKPALIRSLAISVVDDIDKNNNLGAVVIGSQAANSSQNILAKGEIYQWDYIGGPSIGRVSPLGPKRENLTTSISTLVAGGGQAASQYWVAAPMKALETSPGAKNIIILTDGQSCTQNCKAAGGGSDEQATINLARTVAAQGGRVYVVGVKPGLNDDFMTALAEAGNGIYFPADQRNKLRILFGNPDENQQAPDAFGLVILDTNHFITRDVKLSATMYGFNEVVPKSYSNLLVTAGAGQPALTTWQYGVGRVAALTTYNGDDYGELVTKDNSLLLSRTGNWLIGDPERKQDYAVTVPPMHVGEPAVIAVQSTKIPVNDQLTFSLREKNMYEATFTPDATGFGIVGGIPYAATYSKEYEQVGMNPALEQTLSIAGGKLFEPDDVDGIIEHVQTVRSLQEVRKQPLRYPFLLAAAILFLLEIAIRRIYELRRKS